MPRKKPTLTTLPTHVYVVMGEDDSDDSEPVCDWCVAAYPDKETAELHARHANTHADFGNYPADPGDEDESDRYERWLDEYNPFDDAYQNGQVGAYYYVVEVPLFLHPDAYLEQKGY